MSSGRRIRVPCAHAVHTTHPDVVRRIATEARASGRRTSIHLAEHPGERLAIEEGAGPMAAWIAARSALPAGEILWPRRPLFDVADELGLLAPHVLLVHLTDARPDEIRRVTRGGAPVVLCPRSNLWIEGATPPVEALLRAGVVPALGTDSLASNASLDVLEEAATLARRFPDLRADLLVEMATRAGADALGFPHLGRIARGTRPGLLAVEAPISADPARFLLDHVDLPRAWVSAP